MRDIGDVDSQLKAAIGKDVDIDGIIEVAGGCGVNRDGVAVSKIVSLLQIALTNRIGELRRFILYFFWKLCR